MTSARIVYSSRTGNTRTVAEHLASAFGLPLSPLRKDGSADLSEGEGSLLVLGFWTWRGGPDPATRAFLRTLRGRRVFAFGTMAAWPDSEHARRCGETLRALLEEGGNTLVGRAFCQGRLDPAVLAKSRHPMTPERLRRLAEAETHPDAADLRAVEASLASVLDALA